MKATLEFLPLGDCSGCTFALIVDGARVKSWPVKYGYCTPTWQEQERKDRQTAHDELTAWGFPELAAKVLV